MKLFETLSPSGAPVFAAALPNQRGSGSPHHQLVRNDDELRAFITDRDKRGYGLFFTVAALSRPWRAKLNVKSSDWIFADIDFKHYPVLTPEQILTLVKASPYPPTLIVFSGHGYHLYWLLNETLSATPGPDQQYFEKVLRLACAYLSGDSQVAECSHLLRIPGSHNSKNENEFIPVEIVVNTGRRYEASDLAEFWEGAQPILPAVDHPKKNGHAPNGDGTYSSEPPVDVDLALEEMTYGAQDGTGVNATYCAVMWQMLRTMDWDEAVVRFADAAMAAGERAGEDWDREAEIDQTYGRATSTLKSLFFQDYDFQNGGIPDWLPDKHRDTCDQIVRAGHRPELSRNRYGFFLRSPKGSKQNGNDDTAATPGDKPVSRTSELLKQLGPVWKYGDVLPAHPPMLVPLFVPAVPSRATHTGNGEASRHSSSTTWL